MRPLLAFALASSLITVVAAHADPVKHARVKDLVQPVKIEREDTSEHVAALRAAIGKHDAAAIAALLDQSLITTGLWFADPSCNESFSRPGTVEGKSRMALARCLATLELDTTTHHMPPGGILAVRPGLELAVTTGDDDHVSILGFEDAAKQDRDDYLPTLSPSALDALRVGGLTHPTITADLRERLERASTAGAQEAWFAVCVDQTGKTTVTLNRATSRAAAELGKYLETWSLKPYQLRGSPTAACGMVRVAHGAHPPDALVPRLPYGGLILGDEPDGFEVNGEVGEGYDVGDRPPPPPPGPPPPQMVVPTQLESMRIAGEKNIAPDDDTKRAIARAGKDKVIGSFKVCLDTKGAITVVTRLKSTGFSAYDAELIAGIKEWRYRPYEVFGKVVPVCSAVTFIYSQPLPAAPPAKP